MVVLFWLKKMLKKEYYGNESLGLAWDYMKLYRCPYLSLLTMISVSLFCCCKKVFPNIDNSMEHHNQRKKIFTVT